LFDHGTRSSPFEARRLDDVLERAACFDREADCAAADGQARDTLRSLRGEKERCRRADVGAYDVGRSEAPFVDQPGEERSGGVRRDQLRAAVRMAKARHVDRNDPPGRRDTIPDAAERPEALGPRRQQQNGDVGVCLRVREPHAHSVADPEIGGDRAHLSSPLPNSMTVVIARPYQNR